jgi:GNAT superfamily N-acetyltransferase
VVNRLGRRLVSRRLVDLTLDNLSELAEPCRSCVYWELDPAAGQRATAAGAAGLEKEAWVSDTLLEWGSCGKLLYLDSAVAGYILFAPPAFVPRAAAFPTSPVSPDAVLLMGARMDPAFRGAGLGRMLIQGVARDVTRRGVKAVEAFGREDAPRTGVADCVVPAGYLRAVGFKTVRPHPRYSRLRLEVRSIASWREDVEYAVERLLISMAPPALSRS